MNTATNVSNKESCGGGGEDAKVALSAFIPTTELLGKNYTILHWKCLYLYPKGRTSVAVISLL
jgi:hypothetical protein